MKILHVVSALAGGGAEIFVKDLSLSCVQAGHKMAIAYISSARDQGNDAAIEGQFKSELAAGQVAVFEIGHGARKNPLRGAGRLREIISNFRPDVLHIHLGQGLLFRSLMLRRIPTIYTHHNTIFKFGRALSAWFDIFLDGYVAICKSCEVLLQSRTRRPITLIRNGISSRRVAAANAARGTGAFKIISVGRISAQKNYRSIIGIARHCRKMLGNSDMSIRFRICGDGADIDLLRSETRSAGVDDIVQFLGARPDVPELMAEADVLLMTSIYEGMPITLIEAAHAGLPLIATDVGGCPEIVEHGVNGFLFSPDDDAVAAELLVRLMTDTKLRELMSDQSRRTALEFGMQHVTEQHLKLYQGLVSGA